MKFTGVNIASPILSVLSVKSRNVLFETEGQCICKGGGRHLREERDKTAYLEPIRNALQKPVEDLPLLRLFSAKTLGQHKKRGKEV